MSYIGIRRWGIINDNENIASEQPQPAVALDVIIIGDFLSGSYDEKAIAGPLDPIAHFLVNLGALRLLAFARRIIERILGLGQQRIEACSVGFLVPGVGANLA